MCDVSLSWTRERKKEGGYFCHLFPPTRNPPPPSLLPAFQSFCSFKISPLRCSWENQAEHSEQLPVGRFVAVNTGQNLSESPGWRPPLQERQGSRKPIKKHATTTRDTSVKPFPIPSRHPTSNSLQASVHWVISGHWMPGSDLIAIVWPKEGFKTRLGTKNKVWNAFKIQVILPLCFFFFS